MSLGLNGSENLQPIPAKEVVKRLLQHPMSFSREFISEKDFTIGLLKRLVFGRIEEVFFTENSGTLFVNERVSQSSKALQMREVYKAIDERAESGILVAHIHPKNHSFNNKALSENNSWISWPDIWNIAFEFHPQARYLLFSPQFCLEYTTISGNAEAAFDEFSDEKAVDCYKWLAMPDPKGRPWVGSLDPKKQTELAIEFSLKNRMIVRSVNWDNATEMKHLADLLNLR